MKKPNFFLVGFPRSGTTAMYTYLKQHPDIFMSSPKEPNHFCTDLIKQYRSRSSRIIPYAEFDKYIKLFESAGDEKIIGEASVFYSGSKVAAKNINKFNPNAKLLIMLRNPVDFLYSYYGLMRRSCVEVDDFEAAINLELTRRQGKKIPKDVKIISNLFYSDKVKYTEHVKKFVDVFSEDQVKIVIFEDMINDPSKTYNEILKFLGVEYFNDVSFEKIHENEVLRSRKLRSFFHNPSVLKMLKNILPTVALKELRIIYPKIIKKKMKREPLSPEVRVRLMKRFRPHVEEFSKFMNRDLISFWGYGKIK